MITLEERIQAGNMVIWLTNKDRWEADYEMARDHGRDNGVDSGGSSLAPDNPRTDGKVLGVNQPLRGTGA